MLFFLFFLSGLSGLLYQVVWVREFGAAFGATIHTTSLVVATFMLGLGVGSYVIGLWADRRYERAPDSLLRAYGVVELLIAALGLAVTLVLPHTNALAASWSWYVREANGWFVPSTRSYGAQAAMAFVLLAPITLLMGGTLTLLIRHRVRADVDTASGSKIAALYAVNTLGAAAGAYLTDFALVPALGLRSTQFIAVALNAVAGLGAIALARAAAPARAGTRPPKGGHYQASGTSAPVVSGFGRTEPVVWTAIALALSGFAGMGMEILWLRHFNVLLGGFRAVFSLVLTVMLLGIGAGALLGGAVDRRVSRPAHSLMIVQTLLAILILGGVASNSVEAIAAARALALPEFWFNARPMLLEVGLPALLMGATFPLGNAAIQHAERLVGRRAGVLYLANTVGAVGGSLVAGYVLLPRLGMQGTAAALAFVAALTIAPLYLLSSASPALRTGAKITAVTCLVVVSVALDAWLRLPDNYLLLRAIAAPQAPEKLTAVREGVTEIAAITDMPGRGRALLTNGHAMSSTAILDQRYMRALVHIPLLMEELSTRKRVLVIGFGVGNSAHAATLHPSVERVEVADLSRQILELAPTFRQANGNVLEDPRVQVYVNDGRQHLQMQREGTYDLITLEPPPIAHAGVGSLYSREFYELARTRLRPGGYLSQWLPAYQVPPDTVLSMARAFIDVVPHAVLLSGTQAELLLVGTTAGRLELDPRRFRARLDAEPRVAADLTRVDLGTVREIVGTFLGSSETLARATREARPVTDDRPLQEYSVRSVLATGDGGVPASLVDLPSAAKWCPACFSGEASTPEADGLEAYLALMDEVYHAPFDSARATTGGFAQGKPVLGSRYLGAVLPDTANVHNIVGVILLDQKKYDEAAAEFRESLKQREDSPEANRNLGTALAALGNVEEAITYLQRAVRLAPGNEFVKKELEDVTARSTASRATSSRRPPS